MEQNGMIYKNENHKILARPIFAAAIIIFLNYQLLESMENNVLVSANAIDLQTILVKVNQNAAAVQPSDVHISPSLKILSASSDDHTLRLTTDPLDLSKEYHVALKKEKLRLLVDPVLDKIYSAKELGCTWDDQFTHFRLFAPRATSVTLFLFESIDDTIGAAYAMSRDENGVWESRLDGRFFGRFYAYSVAGPGESFDPGKLVADPYSRAVATTNDYLHRGKTLILDTGAYNWDGDQPVKRAANDLVIYECHIRDLTAHASSDADRELAGTYEALLQNGIRGGLQHIKSLGVNAVEFLPIQDFGNIEPPYGVAIDGVANTWNPYARNHWGYMTSYFFAPESYYATGQSLEEGKISGADGRQVEEFKDVVKAFHKQGVAVIMDVVYNHVSQYDQNCFKLVDKNYYFHLNEDDSYCTGSGCGNDFKTDRLMARRLILDSIKYWMQEYHIDGFRFDLAAMIDWQTCDDILKEARKINPDAIIIAEPWGGGRYAPAEFSQHGWAAWNDQFRNGVKGQNPAGRLGFIFGQWFDHNNLETMKRYILGSLVRDGGLFQKTSHSVNYLESHDDNTLGDFIRLGLGGSEQVADVDANAVLSDEQLKLNKLAALFIFVSQGPVMIHEGQEWARSKVIAATDAPDDQVGRIDHNSYNKDNETNWLNFDHAEMNSDLVDYYKGLIQVRDMHPALRNSMRSDFAFFDDPDNSFAFAFHLKKAGSGDVRDLFVILNGDRDKSAEFELPAGEWHVIADGETAGLAALYKKAGKIEAPPSSGMILMQ